MPRSVDTDVFVLPDGTAIQEGLTLAVDESIGTGDASRRIRWERVTDGPGGSAGGLVAQIEVDSFTNSDEFHTTVYGQTPTKSTQYEVVTSAADGSTSTFHMESGPGLSEVYFETTGGGGVNSHALVTDSHRHSGFVQMPTEQALGMIAETYVQGGMPAVAAGGTVGMNVINRPFGGRTPVGVLAQFTTGGSIFFSNQYIIGCYAYIANGFSFELASGFAIAAGWSIGISYIAFFNTAV